MKCLNCSKELTHHHARLCEECAGELIDRMKDPSHLQPPLKPKSNQPTPQIIIKADRSAFKVTDILPSNSAAFQPNSKLIPIISFAGISCVILMIILISIFLPYYEIKSPVNVLSSQLPQTKIEYKEIIDGLKSIAQSNREFLPQPDQISSTKRLINELAQLPLNQPDPSLNESPRLFTDLKGMVAGMQTGIPLSNDRSMMSIKALVDQLETYLQHGIQNQNIYQNFADQIPNSSLGNQLRSHTQEFSNTSIPYLNEATIVLNYYKFNFDLALRLDEIGTGLQNAFVSEDVDTISQTLDDVITDLTNYNQLFGTLAKPNGAESQSNLITSTLQITNHFFKEVSASIATDDYDRMVTAANLYIESTNQTQTNSASDPEEFWNNLVINDLYSHFNNAIQSLKDSLNTITASSGYQVVSLIP